MVLENVLAVIASELANGNLEERPWLASVPDDIEELTVFAITNVLMLSLRAERFGSRTEPLVESLVYLILAAARSRGGDRIQAVVRAAWPPPAGGADKAWEDMRRSILLPIIQQCSGNSRTCARGSVVE